MPWHSCIIPIISCIPCIPCIPCVPGFSRAPCCALDPPICPSRSAAKLVMLPPKAIATITAEMILRFMFVSFRSENSLVQQQPHVMHDAAHGASAAGVEARAPLAIDQINCRGVIDRIVAGSIRPLSLEKDLVLRRDLGGRCSIAIKPQKPRIKSRHILREHLGGIARGIHRDEKDLHLVALATESFDRLSKFGER